MLLGIKQTGILSPALALASSNLEEITLPPGSFILCTRRIPDLQC